MASVVWPVSAGFALGGGLITVVCGRSATLRGNVMGSLALGFTSPNKMFATASAPLLPAYQTSRTALTLSIHGMVTAVPVSNTTIVLGLAAATCAIKSSWLSGRDKLGK